MSEKYKIKSVSNILTMIVDFKDQSGQNKTIHVGLDYLQRKVHFVGDIPKDIDISELEQSILMYVEPESIDELSVPNEIWQRAMEIKTGKFENNEFMNFQG